MHIDTEKVNVPPQSSARPWRQQQTDMRFLNLGSNPYFPQATKLYDDSCVLIPKKNDTIKELLTKAQRIGNVLEEGASLALSTNKLLTLNGGKTPEQKAISLMLDDQRNMYEIWKKGELSLPLMDAEKCRIPSSNMGCKSVTERNTRGEAMRRLHNQGNLDEEHYLWFVTDHTYLVPLVNAIKRLIKAERNAVQGDDNTTSLDLEECQTINKFLAVFGPRQEEIANFRIGSVNRAFHRVVSLATERKRAISFSRKECATETAAKKASGALSRKETWQLSR